MNVENFNNIMLNNILEADLNDAMEQAEIPRDILNKKNPYDLTDEKFVRLFRLTKDLCQEVEAMVTPFVAAPTRQSALTIETKVLATLRFLASGSYQEMTGSNCFVGISQASASRAITEVVNALNQAEVLNEHIHFPQTLPELEALRRRFFQRYQMPGVTGCIDCTHVAIVSPHHNDDNFPEHVYVNRKNYHSLNVQLVCDADLNILNVDARFPGSVHDAHIWRQSPVSTFMERVYRRNLENVFFLLGDSGYPTRPWLLTPINNPQNVGEERFNSRLCSTRSLIERCNGVLKNRFRCLLRYRTLHYSPTMAGKIVNACCVLHNLCISNNVPEVEELHPVAEPDYGMYAVDNNFNLPQRGGVHIDLAAARNLQQNIILNHFNQ